MEKTKQEDWISTLRGFAILLVFISHLESEGGATFKFVIGRIGVVIFFLLSGYLAVNARKKRSASQYIFNRLIRMYPMYWVILILKFLSRNLLQIGDSISIITLLANMTLFHQFIGIEEILGASWMMPMQVFFFVTVGIFGIEIFTSRIRIKNLFVDMKTITITILMMLAIVTGIVRYRTGLPFPTAFFLLIAVAFLGVDFFLVVRGRGYIPFNNH